MRPQREDGPPAPVPSRASCHIRAALPGAWNCHLPWGAPERPSRWTLPMTALRLTPAEFRPRSGWRSCLRPELLELLRRAHRSRSPLASVHAASSRARRSPNPSPRGRSIAIARPFLRRLGNSPHQKIDLTALTLQQSGDSGARVPRRADIVFQQEKFLFQKLRIRAARARLTSRFAANSLVHLHVST